MRAKIASFLTDSGLLPVLTTTPNVTKIFAVSIKFLLLRGANKHIFVKDFLDLMRSMTSSQCQQTAEDWFNKSVALHDQGNYADAIQALDEAIRLSPNDPNNAIAWNNKGLALYSQGEYDEAVNAYEEAIRLNPRDADAWIGKGSAIDREI